MVTEVLALTAHGRTYRMQFDVPHGQERAHGKIASCMREGRPYESTLLEHIHRQGFTGTAIDVGANRGNHTLWLAVVCGLQVVAFEPLFVEMLRANVALNNLNEQVRIEPVALGDERGSASSSRRGRLAVRARRPRRLRLRRQHGLPVRRLDGYKLNGVSLIKVDVEGMESAVLRGGEGTIRRNSPVIFTEEWGEAEHAGIAAFLEPLGYTPGQAFRDSPHAMPVRRWNPRPP